MLKYSIVILALWIFSLLTGSSSSVLRSAVMFSCIAFGKVFNRKSSVYNSLAASAFILLCYNPNLIWDVGFQLSYLAILGIVVLQKPIQHFVSSNGIIKRKLWEMISITLAAQIFTFPICLYYFHQFPTLFLLSNIISVPLSTVILFMEILLIAISPLPALAKVIGFVAEQSIKFLNGFISFLSDLSFSTLDNIYADKSTTAILYIILILLVAFYFKKNKELLKWSLISVTLFFCCIANAFIKIEKQKKIIFYNYSHKKAIDFIEGSDFCFEGSFDKIEQDKLRKNILNSSRKYFGANTESNHLKGLYKKENVFLFHDKVIVMIDSAVKYKTLLNPISIDILYISNNPGIELKELIKSMNPKIVLFAGSNKNYRINKWKIECETLGLKYHSIKENGAFICTIE